MNPATSRTLWGKNQIIKRQELSKQRKRSGFELTLLTKEERGKRSGRKELGWVGFYTSALMAWGPQTAFVPGINSQRVCPECQMFRLIKCLFLSAYLLCFYFLIFWQTDSVPQVPLIPGIRDQIYFRATFQSQQNLDSGVCLTLVIKKNTKNVYNT